jgi:hypothetical protein
MGKKKFAYELWIWIWIWIDVEMEKIGRIVEE